MFDINMLPHVQLSKGNPLPEMVEIGYPFRGDIWGNPVKWYIAGSFGENRRLRQGEGLSPLSRWWILGMKCRPKYRGNLYRGLKNDPDWSVGEETIDKGFVATSKQLEKATNSLYCREALLVILDGEGYDISQPPVKEPIGPYKPIRAQGVSGEQEVVMLPGTRFQIIAKGEVQLPFSEKTVVRYVLKQL